MVQTICADDIIYIKPRNSELLKNELKASFEYNEKHGPVSVFVTAAVSDTVLSNPNLEVLDTIDTVKFEQKADGNWEVIFSDSNMTNRMIFPIERSEIDEICQRNHIRLLYV